MSEADEMLIKSKAWDSLEETMKDALEVHDRETHNMARVMASVMKIARNTAEDVLKKQGRIE